jgi:hypothetical protein
LQQTTIKQLVLQLFVLERKKKTQQQNMQRFANLTTEQITKKKDGNDAQSNKGLNL